MEKAMAPHSSILALKIPWMEEPGGLQSTGSLRVKYDWAISLSLFTFMHWRRKWQPTPVFLPGKSQGRGSLVGCRLWGCTELDMTEVTWHKQNSLLFILFWLRIYIGGKVASKIKVAMSYHVPDTCRWNRTQGSKSQEWAMSHRGILHW